MTLKQQASDSLGEVVRLVPPLIGSATSLQFPAVSRSFWLDGHVQLVHKALTLSQESVKLSRQARGRRTISAALGDVLASEPASKGDEQIRDLAHLDSERTLNQPTCLGCDCPLLASSVEKS